MRYIDAFVIPIPKRNLKAYLKMARIGKKTWMKHGAVEYYECAAEDLRNSWGKSFTQLARPKRGETLIVAFIVFKSRAHRDRVNAKVMKEFTESGVEMGMPFEPKRAAYGGFDVIVGS